MESELEQGSEYINLRKSSVASNASATFQKSLGHFQPTDVSEVYRAIQDLEKESFPVSLLCEALNVSRSAYYAWRQDELSERRREDNRLRPLIRSIFWEHRRRYGARRIAVELAARHEPCGRRRVARLMDEMGLVAIQPRSFKPRTTDSRHSLGYSPNLLIDVPPPEEINQLRVTDISLLHGLPYADKPWYAARERGPRFPSRDFP